MKVFEHTPLAKLSTIRLGGVGQYLIECNSMEEVISAVQFTKGKQLSVIPLGGGSNIVFPDGVLKSVLIKINITSFDLDEDCSEVTSGAGMNWDLFVQKCVQAGLAGVECLSGIPGTVGAVPIQNVGAYGQEVAQTIIRVECLHKETLKTKAFTASECLFAYRDSIFKCNDNPWIILNVKFRLKTELPEIRYGELKNSLNHKLLDHLSLQDKLAIVREQVIVLRRGKGMVLSNEDPNTVSAGSFFKNPTLDKKEYSQFLATCEQLNLGKVPSYPNGEQTKIAAAWLIEQSGFTKGQIYKGIKISDYHALALVNIRGNTAELAEFVELIRSQVYNQFGLLIEPEPVWYNTDGQRINF